MTGRGRCAVDDAAAAAAYAAASISEIVPCGAHLQEWTRLEHDFASLGRCEQRDRLKTVHAICGPCPALEECAAWAREDKYSGFAAGDLYLSGSTSVRRRAHVTSRRDVEESAIPPARE